MKTENIAKKTQEKLPLERETFNPDTDIIETPKSFVLLMDIPGVEEKDLDITLEKNHLQVRGKVNNHPSFSFKNFTHAEYEVGNFERIFNVSSEIEREEIEAKFSNGVLHLTLPKSKAQQPRKINITVS